MIAQEKATVFVGPDGLLKFIYADELVELLELGQSEIARASNVEPAESGGWSADMALSGGPVLGPMPLRSQALAAEVEWLNKRMEECFASETKVTRFVVVPGR